METLERTRNPELLSGSATPAAVSLQHLGGGLWQTAHLTDEETEARQLENTSWYHPASLDYDRTSLWAQFAVHQMGTMLISSLYWEPRVSDLGRPSDPLGWTTHLFCQSMITAPPSVSHQLLPGWMTSDRGTSLVISCFQGCQ